MAIGLSYAGVSCRGVWLSSARICIHIVYAPALRARARVRERDAAMQSTYSARAPGAIARRTWSRGSSALDLPERDAHDCFSI